MRRWALMILFLAGCGDRKVAPVDAGPVEQLPPQVIAPPGQVTLFADFDNAKDGHVALYVVNRTERTAAIATQHGVPFFKLEARNDAGQWERAEAHRYAGPSIVTAKYYPVQVPAGTFRVFEGFFPERGEPRPVRFREYKFRPEQGLVSNAAEGLVSPTEIRRLKGDRMTALYGGEDEVLAIAMGEVPAIDDYGRVRLVAISNLDRFKNRRTAKALAGLLQNDDPAIVREAAATLGAFDALAGPAHTRLLELTANSNAPIRRAAVATVGRLRIERALPHLLPCLKDGDALVRRHAAAALAMLGDRAAIPHLEPLLQDRDRTVRDKAAWAIRVIRER